jgi:hypothetical protein
MLDVRFFGGLFGCGLAALRGIADLKSALRQTRLRRYRTKDFPSGQIAAAEPYCRVGMDLRNRAGSFGRRLTLFERWHVSSAGFPTPTSLASTARMLLPGSR